MKKIISLTLIFGLLVSGSLIYFEPEAAKAVAVSDSITVTQSVTSEISITAPADVTMSSAIPGITGNAGAPRTGSATWTVITNNATGFTLGMAASDTPAMQLDTTWNFTDYTEATSTVPDYTWSSPAASAAEFGFSVEPATAADTIAKYLDNALDLCNTGSTNTANKCWYSASTTAETVINRSTQTASAGEAEVIKFQTESNAKYLKEGSYIAYITVTATEN